MPYYVYRIESFAVPRNLGEHDAYALASAQAKAWRADATLPRGDRIRIMFAETEQQAEDLLSTRREASPAGDD